MQYYTIQAIYTDRTDNNEKLYTKKNLDAQTLMKFRREVFQAGLFVPVNPLAPIDGSIISPFDIRVINVYMQDKRHD